MRDSVSDCLEGQIQFDAIFEYNPSSVIYADQQRQILRVNRKFTELYGYTEEECLGRTTKFLYADPEDYSETGRKRYNVDAPLQPDAYVLPYRRKDGSIFFGETVGVQLKGADGRMIGYLGVTRDITEQIKFETERSRVFEELKRSREFLAETEEIARIGGGELDLDTYELTWSEGLQRLHGLPPGTTPSFEDSLAYFEPGGRAMLKEALKAAAREGEAFDMELPFQDAEGRKMWVRTSAHPVYEDGKIVKVRGFLQDITSQKQAELAKREFVSMVSHELRTPLSAITVTLELIRRRIDELPEDLGSLISMAVRNGRRLRELVDDILDAEAIDTGQMRMESALFELDDVVDDVVRANRPFVEAYDVSLATEFGGAGSCVCLDPGRFDQILTNLISNAVKFSPPGETVTIKTECVGGDQVRVSVIDCGPGIPEEFQDELFEKFTRASNSVRRSVPGTGLGLSIARGLTEKMGGQIGFETAPGRGTTMTVEFPLRE